MLGNEVNKLEDKNKNLETQHSNLDLYNRRNLDLYNRRNNVEVLASMMSLTMGNLKTPS